MSLFRWKSRKKLKAEIEFYKTKYFDETKYSDKMKADLREAEQQAKSLKDENEKLVSENQRLKDENLAKYNIIEGERRKAKKQKAKMDQMQRHINQMSAKRTAGNDRDDYEPFPV